MRTVPLIHYPRIKSPGEFQYMNSLCGKHSTSSASTISMVTCKDCLKILEGMKK